VQQRAQQPVFEKLLGEVLQRAPNKWASPRERRASMAGVHRVGMDVREFARLLDRLEAGEAAEDGLNAYDAARKIAP
jgi:hypothetical protein